MKKIKFCSMLLLLAMALVTCSSCMTVMLKPPDSRATLLNKDYATMKNIHEAIVYVGVEMTFKFCNGSGEDKDCTVKKMAGSGSGFSLATTSKGTYVGTAAHVCKSELGLPLMAMLFYEGKEIKVSNFKGQDFGAKIIDYDTTNDLCVLFVPKLFTPVLSVKQMSPEQGERVLTLGYPLGLYSKGICHKFEGFYDGETVIGKILVSAYSILARPGSSGSAIVNVKGEIVGIVLAGLDKINLTLSAPAVVIHGFFTNSIKQHLQKQ